MRVTRKLVAKPTSCVVRDWVREGPLHVVGDDPPQFLGRKADFVSRSESASGCEYDPPLGGKFAAIHRESLAAIGAGRAPDSGSNT